MHGPVVRSWVVCDLRRRARTAVRHRGIDLRSGRTASRRSTDSALTRTRTSRAGRRLAWEPIRPRPLLVGLLERGLLGWRRRGWGRASWHARSGLRDLVLGSGRLLILRGRLRRQPSTLTTLAGYYPAKKVVSHADGRRGRPGGRAAVLRRAGNAWLRRSAAGLLKLTAQ